MVSDSELLWHFLQPTLIYASEKPTLIQTILGSCVSVCLWDTKLHIGGMNHYMLPLWNGNGLATPKYGNIAIEKLIEKMLSLGCRKKDLVAKTFGGGKIIETNKSYHLQIGSQNIIIADEMLKSAKIPVIIQNTGGTHGRKIQFYTNTGVVLHKFIQKNT